MYEQREQIRSCEESDETPRIESVACVGMCFYGVGMEQERKTGGAEDVASNEQGNSPVRYGGVTVSGETKVNIEDFDIANRFMVGAVGTDLLIMNISMSHARLSRKDALNLAAWLAALADPSGECFDKILDKVRNT